MNNEAPGLTRGGMSPGIRPLFHSRREIALIKDKSAAPGFGLLKHGTVMATDVSTGNVVPVPTSAAAPDASRALLQANYGTGTSVVSLLEADAAKFSVGDAVVVNNETPAYADLGTVVSKAAPDANGIVVITVSGSAATAVMTTALTACLSHKTKAATPFYAASCLLDKDVDTGTTADEQPVPVSVVFKNAMVYSSFLVGMTSQSLTDLGAIQDGVHTIF